MLFLLSTLLWVHHTLALPTEDECTDAPLKLYNEYGDQFNTYNTGLPIGHARHPYRCLAFYENTNTFNLTSTDPVEVEELYQSDLKSSASFMQSMWTYITNDFYKFFEEKDYKLGYTDETTTFLYSFYINVKGIESGDIFDKVMPSCPLGLVFDWVCVSYLKQPQDCSNTNLTTHTDGWPSTFRYICQDDFDALLEVCVSGKEEQDEFRRYFDGSYDDEASLIDDSRCGKINFIYQGRPALGDLKNTTIKEYSLAKSDYNESFYDGMFQPEKFSDVDALRNVSSLFDYEFGEEKMAMVSVMGTLYPVCGNGWTLENAHVFCADLGRQIGQTWNASSNSTVPNYGTHFLGGVRCRGDERQFVYCQSDGWYRRGNTRGSADPCSVSATVTCQRNEPPIPPPVPPTVPPTEPSDEGKLVTIIVTIISFLLGILLCIAGAFYYFRYCRRIEKKTPDDASSTLVGTQGSPCPQSEPNGSSMRASEPPTMTFGATMSMSYPVSMEFSQPSGPVAVTGEILQVFRPPEDPETRKPRNAVFLFRPDLANTEPKEYICKQYETQDGSISEQQFLKDHHHANIIALVRESETIRGRWPSVEGQPRSEFNTVVMGVEYLPLGDFSAFVQSKQEGEQDGKGHFLTVKDVDSIVNGACAALAYLHNSGFTHGDISSDNFFVTDTTPKNIKLGDFETIQRADSEKYSTTCTARFASPELILKFDNPAERNLPVTAELIQKNDVWGLGLFIWEVTSWLTCGKNRHTDTAETVVDPRATAQQTEQLLLSVFHYEQFNRFIECDKNKHLSLYEKLAIHHSDKGDNPKIKVMKDYYSSMYPHHISRPSVHPDLNTLLGWPVSDLIERCLEVDPSKRASAQELMNEFQEESYLPLNRRMVPSEAAQGDLVSVAEQRRDPRRRKPRFCWEGQPSPSSSQDNIDLHPL